MNQRAHLTGAGANGIAEVIKALIASYEQELEELGAEEDRRFDALCKIAGAVEVDDFDAVKKIIGGIFK